MSKWSQLHRCTCPLNLSFFFFYKKKSIKNREFFIECANILASACAEGTKVGESNRIVLSVRNSHAIRRTSAKIAENRWRPLFRSKRSWYFLSIARDELSLQSS